MSYQSKPLITFSIFKRAAANIFAREAKKQLK